MINLIGAIITVILGVGIAQAKPSPRRFEAGLAHGFWVIDVIVFAIVSYMVYVNLTFELQTPKFPNFLINWAGFFIHEGGHFFMSWSTEFMHIFGGTMFEAGVPFALCLWFLVVRCYRCFALGLVWLSQAWFSIALYAGDAQDMVLELVGGGGNKQAHDWRSIFSILDVLEHTDTIASAIYSAGVITSVMAIGVYLAAMFVLPPPAPIAVVPVNKTG